MDVWEVWMMGDLTESFEMTELEYQKEIGRLFSEMEEYIRNNSIEKVSIRFPRGVLRKADDFRSELYFIDDSTFKTNIAYHLMLTDLYHWFLNRFDIGLTAQEMLIKAEFCLYGNICGAIAQCFDKKLLNLEQVGVKRALSALIKNGIIDEDLKKRIMDIWGQRNKEHILSLKEKEYDKYNLEKYDKTVFTWREFKKSLQKARDVGNT